MMRVTLTMKISISITAHKCPIVFYYTDDYTYFKLEVMNSTHGHAYIIRHMSYSDPIPLGGEGEVIVSHIHQ